MGDPVATARVDGSLLDGVLAVVRRLGGSSSLGEALDLVLDGIVRVVGFGAAAINVTTPDGVMRVDAVRGPPGVERLLGTERPMSFWTEVLAVAEPWGDLRFFGHDRDQTLVDQFTTWTSAHPAGPEPDAWDPDDSLLAPMWDATGELIGVISVDQPSSGRRPDQQQRTILEVFARQAARAILDAQERQSANAKRREAEGRWRLAFEHSPIGVALVGVDRVVIEANDALVSMLGTTREKLLATTWTSYTHPDDVDRDVALFTDLLAGKRDGYQIEKRFVRADGSVLWASLHVAATIDTDDLYAGNGNGRVSGTQTIVSLIVDITERKLAAELSAHHRTHDLLTDLRNRTGIAEEITRMLTLGRGAGVLFCDIDGFRTISSGLGRDAGDEVLAALAQRLLDVVPDGGVVGRVSGDQFAVLVPDEVRPEPLLELGERILATLDTPLRVGESDVRIGMTIGCALNTDPRQNGDELLRQAEQSLANAKLQARGTAEIYDPTTVHVPTRDDLSLDQDLRTAVDSGEGLTVHLQPIVNLESGAVVGAESLLRWHHAARGDLLPDSVLAIAEQSGLIVPLGSRILELGLDAALASGAAINWVAVNVSGKQLGRGLLPDEVRRSLEARAIAPERLHLEITETALAHASPRAISEVEEIAEMGVSIALDDFGTGYSSLSLLRTLPISVVKIDRSFIAPIAEDRRSAALVRSLVAMCDSLDISTVAEGVETLEQRAVVTALGCDHAQGYLFGRPVPVAGLGLDGAPSGPERRPRPFPRPS